MIPNDSLGIVSARQDERARYVAAYPHLADRMLGRRPKVIASKTHAITVNCRTGERTVAQVAPNPFVAPKPRPARARHVPVREIKLRQILDAVAAAYEVTLTDMMGYGRCRRWSYPRFAAYRIVRASLGWSTTIIGRSFLRDHTTVISGMKRAEWLLENNRDWSRRYAAAVAELERGVAP